MNNKVMRDIMPAKKKSAQSDPTLSSKSFSRDVLPTNISQVNRPNLRDLTIEKSNDRAPQRPNSQTIPASPNIRRPKPQTHEEIEDENIDNFFRSKARSRSGGHDAEIGEYNLGDRYTSESGSGSRFFMWLLFIVFLLAAAFGISTLFQNATITIVPKEQTVSYSKDLVALANPQGDSFGYEITTVSTEFATTVKATSFEKVTQSAHGKITVFNQTLSSQRLVEGTRFETVSHKIYKSDASATIPAGTIKAGKTVPGSMDITVIANAPGTEYNIGSADFTIPGFSGTDKFKLVFGRSKDGMSGGFVGKQNKIDQNVLETTQKLLSASASTGLVDSIRAQIPPTYVLLSGAVIYDSVPATVVNSGTSDVKITQKINAYGIIFDREKLKSKIIDTDQSGQLAGNELEILNLDSLKLDLKNSDSFSSKKLDPITFDLAGDLKVRYSYSSDSLKSDLAGVAKTDMEKVLQSKYPAVQKAYAKISPFWMQFFPKDSNKIIIQSEEVASKQ